MTKKGNQVTVKLEGVQGDTTAAGGNIIQGAPAAGHSGSGGNVLNLEAKEYKGNITAAGGDIITFNSRLEELRAELMRAYAGNPTAGNEITVLTNELAVEAARPPDKRDAGQARQRLQRLEQFALDVGAKVLSAVLVEASKGVFFS